jgi:threonine dehydrogenase-like Zn-dependent dehydrogenase
MANQIIPHKSHDLANTSLFYDVSDRGIWNRNITITTRLVDTATTRILLRAVQSKKFDPAMLITHRYPLEHILDAYETFG